MFDDITEAKLQKIKNLIQELPSEASSHLIRAIFAEYARILDPRNELLNEVVGALDKEGAILILFNGNEYQIESSLAPDAPAVLGEVLDVVKEEIHDTLKPNRS